MTNRQPLLASLRRSQRLATRGRDPMVHGVMVHGVTVLAPKRHGVTYPRVTGHREATGVDASVAVVAVAAAVPMLPEEIDLVAMSHHAAANQATSHAAANRNDPPSKDDPRVDQVSTLRLSLAAGSSAEANRPAVLAREAKVGQSRATNGAVSNATSSRTSRSDRPAGISPQRQRTPSSTRDAAEGRHHHRPH